MLPEPLPSTARRQLLLGWVFEEQALEILQYGRWDLAALATIVFGFQFLLRPGPDLLGLGPAFRNGAVTWPFGLVFVLFAAMWALRVWSSMPAGERDHFLSRPVDRSSLILIRVLAGIGLFVAVFLVAWALGAYATDTFVAGSRLTSSHLRQLGWGWTWNVLGLVNAYLFATIVALRLRNPEQWLLVWIPVATLFLWLACLVIGADGLEAAIRGTVDSLLWGFGIAIAEARRIGGLSMTGWPIAIWSAVLWTGVIVAARVPQRNRS